MKELLHGLITHGSIAAFIPTRIGMFQLTVHVASGLSNAKLCNSGPHFLSYGTLPSYYKESYMLPFRNARLPFLIEGSNMT